MTSFLKNILPSSDTVKSAGKSLGKGVYKAFARDRNILIPIDKPSNTEILSKDELKKKFCTSKKNSPRRQSPRRRRTNLERVTERMG